jgi:hypothetical protein
MISPWRINGSLSLQFLSLFRSSPAYARSPRIACVSDNSASREIWLFRV